MEKVEKEGMDVCDLKNDQWINKPHEKKIREKGRKEGGKEIIEGNNGLSVHFIRKRH